MKNKIKFYGINVCDLNKIMEDIINNNYNIVFYMRQMEVQLNSNFINNEMFENFLKQNNFKFYIIVGAEYNEYFHIKSNGFYNILHWPTYLLHFVNDQIIRKFPNYNQELINKEFNYLFISYNNKNHYHRCILMDLFSKNNLIKDGLISWRMTFPKNYDFKYWNEEILEIDQTKLDVCLNEITNQTINSKCFVNIIAESYSTCLFVTEKTYRAIILEQPFLCFGAINQNRILEKYGFKLYDEIFDYSFDNLKNLEDRAQGIVNNLLHIKTKNLNNLYEKIKEKIFFNKKRAMEIIRIDSFLPTELMTYYDDNKEEYLKAHNDGLFTVYPGNSNLINSIMKNFINDEDINRWG
jgi:hypothetical protein